MQQSVAITAYWLALPSAIAIIYFVRKYCGGKPCSCKATLTGKTVVVTGSNSGIGKETALDLAKRGAKVIIACRCRAEGEKTVSEICETTGNQHVYFYHLNLASFKSIRSFVEEIKKNETNLYALVNNAGLFFVPYKLTEDGWESIFQVNYLGHFLLTRLLLDLLNRSQSSRVVNVSSNAHKMCKDLDLENVNSKEKYKKFKAYSNSKLALVLFTRTLSKKLSDTGVTVNVTDPGNVDTPLFKSFPLLWNRILRIIQWPVRRLTFKTPKEGAQTSIHCVVSQDLNGITGQYLSDCSIKTPSKNASNDFLADKLWKFSLEAVNEKDF